MKRLIFVSVAIVVYVAVFAAAGFGQEVSITQQEFQSALSKGNWLAEKHSFRSMTMEESFADGKKTGYEKHITENLPPDRSRYIYESEYRGEREVRQVIKIGDVSYCKEGDGKWEETNCDRFTGIDASSVLSQSWSKSAETFENDQVTQIRSYLTYSVPQKDKSKPERVLFSEYKTFIDMDGKIVFAESTTGVVGSKEILRRSTTNYEYGLNDLKIEAPIP